MDPERYDALFEAFSGDPYAQEVVAQLVEFENLTNRLRALAEGDVPEGSTVTLDRHDAMILFDGMQEAIEASGWSRFKRRRIKRQIDRLTSVKRDQ